MRDSLRKPFYPIVLVGLALLVLTSTLYLFGAVESVDRSTCKPIYMYPSYARIRSFDESHTKFASKFSLYLYREQGTDPVPSAENAGFDSLDGVPVLFIPGNAGSYRQVRSIAAECSILYFDENINVVENTNMRNLDFFAADFNEDYTAFHGRTLLDQAEYLNEAIKFILSLYSNSSPNPPTSVLILAHSMGGIVARVMPTLPSYLPGSINTMVTLASPHSAAPLTFDGDILKLYSAADRFWHDAFNSPGSFAHKRLHNVSVISITGGSTDKILPADYTSLGFLVPPSNGFTVYSTGIKDVWTTMDHLAIVWCRQLRRVISKALLEVVDYSSPQRIYPLEKRMSIFKRNFLSGFETCAKQDFFQNLAERRANEAFRLKLDARDVAVHEPIATWKSTQEFRKSQKFELMPLSNQSTVSIITSKQVKPMSDSTRLEDNAFGIYLCKADGEAARSFDVRSSTSKESLEFFCMDISTGLNQIPRSSKDSQSLADSALDGSLDPYYALHYKGSELEGFDFLLLFKNPKHPIESPEFIIAQTSDSRLSEHTIRGDLISLIAKGAYTSLPPRRPNQPVSFSINIPGAWSSLLAYKIHLKESSGELFEPFICQSIEEPYETKWLTNLRGESFFSVSMHGVAPYVPFANEKTLNGISLQLWADPDNNAVDDSTPVMQFRLTVDWTNSLKLLILRYRLAIVSHCLAVATLVNIISLLKYKNSGKFPDFVSGLSKLTELNLFIPAFLFLCLITPLTKIRAVQTLLNVIDPVVLQDPNEVNLSLQDDFSLNSFYLGLEETPLCGLGGLFYVMAIGVNYLIYEVFMVIGRLISQFGEMYRAMLDRKLVSQEQKTTNQRPNHNIKKKALVSTFLLLVIPIFLPYQFAYVISFAIQATTCVKILWSKCPKTSWNFNVSLLMMMVWVLPINIPVVIVFVHNLDVKWKTPFSPFHSLLSVAPIIVLVKLCNYFRSVNPLDMGKSKACTESLPNKFTLGALAYLAWYSIIYGIRHTFWLHHLFNFWSCCMCIQIAFQASEETWEET